MDRGRRRWGMEKFSRLPIDKRNGRSKKKQQKRKPRVGKLAHDLLNELSIIKLSCFRLRRQASSLTPAGVRDLDNIENAILEAAGVAETIREKLAGGQKEESERPVELVTSAPIAKTNVVPFPTPRK